MYFRTTLPLQPSFCLVERVTLGQKLWIAIKGIVSTYLRANLPKGSDIPSVRSCAHLGARTNLSEPQAFPWRAKPFKMFDDCRKESVRVNSMGAAVTGTRQFADIMYPVSDVTSIPPSTAHHVRLALHPPWACEKLGNSSSLGPSSGQQPLIFSSSAASVDNVEFLRFSLARCSLLGPLSPPSEVTLSLFIRNRSSVGIHRQRPMGKATPRSFCEEMKRGSHRWKQTK